jgi:hypothetical protein
LKIEEKIHIDCFIEKQEDALSGGPGAGGYVVGSKGKNASSGIPCTLGGLEFGENSPKKHWDEFLGKNMPSCFCIPHSE